VAPRPARAPAAGDGAPLPSDLRSYFEPRLGKDLGQVRVHTDAAAANGARAVHARAYTSGNDIAFAAGQYAPTTPAGKRLIAHELAHVVQQHDGRAGGGRAAMIHRAPVDDLGGTLDQKYEAAVRAARETGDWTDAAVLLNGFNHQDIQSRLARLSPDEVARIHLAAAGNPRVGPDSQLARLTRPGTAPASTSPPAANFTAANQPAPAPATVEAAPAAARSIAQMTAVEKLLAAYERANIGAAVRDKLQSLISPKVLMAAIISFAVVFVLAQFTPVGWAADLALAMTALFVGVALFKAIKHMVKFAQARNATTSAQLDEAGAEFAAGVAEVGIDALILVLTRGAGGAARGGVPYNGPPPPGLVLARAGGGSVVVPVAVNTIPVAVAGQLGVQAAGGTMVLMSSSNPRGGTRMRDFEPPQRDATGKVHSEPGRDIPRTAAERENAVQSWTREELEVAAQELEASIAARQAEQIRLGETHVSATGVPKGAQHRVRIQDEEALLRRVLKKLSGS
jgi:hypothetical protein